MKIAFTKPELQQMLVQQLKSSMGLDIKDKDLSISINLKREDYLVVRVQDKESEE